MMLPMFLSGKMQMKFLNILFKPVDNSQEAAQR